MRFPDDTLRGRLVLSSDGVALGAISRLFVGEDWRVQAFEVKLRREASDRIGIQRSLLHGATVEVPTELVQSIGDAVLLAVPAEALRHPGAERSGAADPRHPAGPGS